MLDHNHDDELDSLIDQALPSYGAEPPGHLEAMIIAGVRSAPMLVKENAPARWLGIASGIAAAGIFAFLVVHSRAHQATKPDQISTAARESPFAPSEMTRVAQPRAIHSQTICVRLHRPHSVIVKWTNPEAPLTAQEQMLAELAARHPNEARQLVALDGEEAKPLAIEPLAVQPISTETLKIATLQIEPLP